MLTGQSIHTLSLLLRRTIVKKAGCWDEQLKRYQEVDFHLSALLSGAKFEYLPLACGLWRFHSAERIHSKTGLSEIMAFYQKWELKLKASGLFTEEMGSDISKWYLYLFSQYRQETTASQLKLLREVVRLNPNVEFYRNPKMRLMVRMIGQAKALQLWIKRFQKKAQLQAKT